MIQTLIYDGSFEGFLTAVFYAYEYKTMHAIITPGHKAQPGLFGDVQHVFTEEIKVARLVNGLKKRISTRAISELYKTFLSENDNMEHMLFNYLKYAFSEPVSIEQDYSNMYVRYVKDTAKKVHREKHRMEAFVRFKKTKDELFYAVVQPDFNVLPLIQIHFEKRYADQHWLIYDVKRKYGIHYNLLETTVVELDAQIVFNTRQEESILDEKENNYGKLWQDYFNSVNIKERKNKKLHQQRVPLRYWRYLTEKKQF